MPIRRPTTIGITPGRSAPSIARSFSAVTRSTAKCAPAATRWNISAFAIWLRKGGPFYDEDYPNPNDNPVIRALAAEFIVMDGPDETGDMFERAGRPADYFPQPFANDEMARLANGGALPPDLSVITKARNHGHGADYLYSLLLGYGRTPDGDPPRPGLYYNPWFPGGLIAMAPPLADGLVTYAEGQPPATVEQMSEDVTAFLAWASDPHQEKRKRLGFVTIAYLSIFAGLMWLSYKQIWKDVKH